MAQKLVLLFVAGGFGTLARYALSGCVQRWSGSPFPWGTLFVNVLGCLVFGCLWAVAEKRLGVGAGIRAVVLPGFLGAFTTYSTFVFETGKMVSTAAWLAAAVNVGVHLVAGLAAFFLGLAAGRLI